MKKSLLAMLLLGQLGGAAVADPTAPEWAKDAVEKVQEAGIMKGYPDGSIGGERPVSRDELAELLNRVDDQMEREQSWMVPKSELEQTQTEAGSLTDEIEAMNQRIDNLEGNTDKLDQRADEVR